MAELDEAIYQTHPIGTTGPDEIPQTFIKALELDTRQNLQDMFKFSSEKTFQAWKVVTILPPPQQAGKPGRIAFLRVSKNDTLRG